MKQLLGSLLMAVLVSGLAGPIRAADDKDVQTVLDKAIKALGGEEKLSAARAFTWKGKGTINFGGGNSDFSSTTTIQGLDHLRSDFEGEFGGNKVKGALVLDGDKGWRKFGDMVMELDKNGVANEKRLLYLQVVPVTVVPLKGKGFKVEAAGTEMVGDKPAVVLKVTGPDGKDFKLYFDQTSDLPVKQTSKVVGFMSQEFTQETTFADYKDFGGIKKATRIVARRDGEKFLEQTITDFKPVEKVAPQTFTKPK
jgi:hypothetical protein